MRRLFKYLNNKNVYFIDTVAQIENFTYLSMAIDLFLSILCPIIFTIKQLSSERNCIFNSIKYRMHSRVTIRYGCIKGPVLKLGRKV